RHHLILLNEPVGDGHRLPGLCHGAPVRRCAASDAGRPFCPPLSHCPPDPSPSPSAATLSRHPAVTVSTRRRIRARGKVRSSPPAHTSRPPTITRRMAVGDML